jgi:hypothetical protein
VLMSLQKAPTREMKAPWTDPGLRELLALAVVAAFGCGLALAQNSLFFAAIFCCCKRSGHRRGAATLSVRSLGCCKSRTNGALTRCGFSCATHVYG